MFHVNPESGNVSPCRAAKGACPYGASAHAETREGAERIYANAMGGAFEESGWQRAETDLWTAVTEGASEAEARHAWNESIIQYGMSEAGAKTLQARLANAEEGSQAQAVLFHIIAEANRRRFDAMTPDELVALIESVPSKTVAKVQPKAVKRTVNHDFFEGQSVLHFGSLDPNMNVPIHGTRGRKAGELAELQSHMKRFLENPEQAQTLDLQSMRPAYSLFANLPYSSQPSLVPNDRRMRWAEEGWRLRKQTWEAAKLALSHPSATAEDFEAVRQAFGDKEVLGLEACPPSVRETYLADQVRSALDTRDIPQDVMAKLRIERMSSNRVTLYLAAGDTDDYERGEAMNLLVAAPMNTLKDTDRYWLASNMHNLPGGEGTKEILRDALRSWAINDADDYERRELLNLVGKKKEEPRRGLFGRR